MSRKNRTPEEKARREKIRELLQMANIGSMGDCKFQPLSTTCTEKQLHVHGDSAPLSRA